MNGAELFVKILEENKINYVCGVTGDFEIPLTKAIMNSKLDNIQVMHEQNGAFVASAINRVSNKLQAVCYSTLGPGALNMIGGVANSHFDRVPLLAFSPQTEGQHQYVDLVSLYKPVTKYARELKSKPYEFSLFVKDAIRIARSEIPGSCFLSLPLSGLNSEVEDCFGYSDGNIDYPLTPTYINTNQKVEEIITKINSAKLPILIVGNLAIRYNSNVSTFVEKTGLPIVTTFQGKNTISKKHKNNIGVLSRHSAKSILDKSDLLIFFGYDQVEGLGLNEEKAIVIDDFFPELLITNKIVKRDFSSFIKKNKVKLPKNKPLKYGIKMEQLISYLNRYMNEDDIIVSDVGLHKQFIGLYAKPRCLFSNGLSYMGYSIPTAIGAQIAEPEKRIVCIIGDGGFLMNHQELATIQRMNLPIKILVINNGSYGLVERAQKQKIGKTKTFGTWLRTFHSGIDEITEIDFNFLNIARGYDIFASNVITLYKDLNCLEDILRRKRPELHEVKVIYNELPWERQTTHR